MLFRKKNKEKNKQSDYQELKDIILNNDNQASMDEAINNFYCTKVERTRVYDRCCRWL